MTDPKKPEDQDPKNQTPENKGEAPKGAQNDNTPKPVARPSSNGRNRPNNAPSGQQTPPDPKKIAAAGAVGLAALAALYFANKSSQGPGSFPAQNFPSNPNGNNTSWVPKNLQKKAPAVAGGVTFDDVAGIDEVKADFQEVVDLIKNNADKSRKSLGGKPPKGALLYGEPGCGKTLITKAIANEAGVGFLHASGSDFIEIYVGTGPKRVRELFAKARQQAPCILFIDEIDALIAKRGVGSTGGDSERNNTVNAFLKEMDGVDGLEGIFVVGATNRLDKLDDAAIRAGRFDRKINVPLPDLNGRADILAVHTKDKVMAEGFNAADIARSTPRFSGADLANLANEAALLAERQGKSAVEQSDFEAAKDKIMMGAGRKLAMSDEEKGLTAWHEAGHALAILMEPSANPIIKATIIPRGGALGMVLHAPEADSYSQSKAQMKASLVVAAAGRAAEELYFGNDDDITSGAMSDIQHMTRVATGMVKRAGLGDKMRNYGDDVNGETGARVSFSEATLQKIDKAIDDLIDESYTNALNHLKENRPALDAIAEALLEKETLTGAEITQIATDAGAQLPERKQAGAAPRSSAPRLRK